MTAETTGTKAEAEATDDVVHKPNWEVWRHVPYATLSELVPLSLNWDPEGVRIGYSEFRSLENSKKLRERILVAERNFHLLSPPGTKTSDPVWFSPFAKWALSVGWVVPPEFAARATEAANAQSVEKALADSERKTLLKIVLAMAVKGYAYDPKAKRDPQSAVKEIAKDTQTLGISVTDDTIRKYLKEAASQFPLPDAEKS